MTAEVWRPFRSGIYEVSSHGRVRRAKQGKRGIKTTGRTHVGLLLSLWVDPDGYAKCWLDSERQTAAFPVHQLVAEAFHGPRPPGCVVDHVDGDKTHNWSANVEWVTKAENRRRQAAQGLNPKGAAHGRAKLSEADVHTIRTVSQFPHVTQTGLAKRFGVSQSLVWAVINRKVWAHV